MESSVEQPLLNQSLSKREKARAPADPFQGDPQEENKDPKDEENKDSKELDDINKFIATRIVVRSGNHQRFGQNQKSSQNLKPVQDQKAVHNQRSPNSGFFMSRLAKGSNYSKMLLTPDEKFILINEGTFTVKEARAQKGRAIITVSANEITALCIVATSDESCEIVFGDSAGRIFRHSYPDTKPVGQLDLHHSRINTLKYSEKHKVLYSAADSLVRTNVENWKSELLVNENVKDFDFFEDQLVYCGESVHVLGHRSFKLSDEKFDAICVSQRHVAAGNNKQIKVWRLDGEEVKVFSHSEIVNSMKFSNTGKEFTAFSKDGSVKIWHLERNCRPKVLKQLTGIRDVVWRHDLSSVHFISKETIDKYLIEPWSDEELISIPQKPSSFASSNEGFAWTDSKDIGFYSFAAKETKILSAKSEVSKVFLIGNSCYTIENKFAIHKYQGFSHETKEQVVSVTVTTILDFGISPEELFLVYACDDSQVSIFDLHTKTVTRTVDKKQRTRIVPLANLQLFDKCFYISSESHFFRIPFESTDAEETVFMDWQGKIKKTKVANDQSLIIKSEPLNLPPPGTPPDPRNTHNFKLYLPSRLKFFKEIEVHQAPISNFEFSLDNLYFLVASEDCNISIWSKETLVMITMINYDKPILNFGFTSETTKLVIVHETEVLITANPVNTNTVQIFGPDRGFHYDVLNYFKKIKEHESRDEASRINMNPYVPQMDQYVFSPSMMNAVHFYSWYQHYEAYYKALYNNSPFYNTKQGVNPLLMLLKRDEQESVIKTINKKITESQTNTFVFNFFNNETLVLLNLRGYAGIEAFYEAIYQPFTKIGLPKCVESGSDLPLVVYSQNLEPVKTKFLPVDRYKKDGIPILFSSSFIRFNMIPGSQESLELLKSLEKCPNKEIFTKPFLKTLLKEKWSEVKWMMMIQGIVYLLYMICLLGFIVNSSYGTGKTDDGVATVSDSIVANFFLYVGQVINMLLMIYELYQMSLLKGEYFEDAWNYVDMGRFLFYTCLVVIIWISPKGFMETDYFLMLLLLVIVTTWIRGLTYFRIFDSVRYLTALIFEVMIDMMSFTVLATYSLIGLSLMLFICTDSGSKNLYLQLLGFTYMTTIGEYASFGQEVQNFKSLGITIFTFASIINTIVMMNLLISIIGDTFDRVQQGSSVTDFKELVKMIYEMETLLHTRKEMKESVFMQRLNVRFGSGEEVGSWEGKVRELTKTVNGVKLDVRKAIQVLQEDRKMELMKENDQRNRIEEMIKGDMEHRKRVADMDERYMKEFERMNENFRILMEKGN